MLAGRKIWLSPAARERPNVANYTGVTETFGAFSIPLGNCRNIGAYSGVSLNMQKRWRMVLPTVGIILFSVVSYHSLRVDRETPSRYFWWSSIRLDSDPSNRRNWGAIPCQDGKEDCWELRAKWVDPGLLEHVSRALVDRPHQTAGNFPILDTYFPV